MEYITIKNDEFLWNQYKILLASKQELFDLTQSNIYITKNNITQIFYVKSFKMAYYKKDFNQFSTRNELSNSLYFLNKREIKNYKRTIESTIKCCEFCFKESTNNTFIDAGTFADIIMCKECFDKKNSESYRVNNRLFRSTNNVSIEMTRKVSNQMFYFYSVQQNYCDFYYMKLKTINWYQIDSSKLCQLSHKNNKNYKIECKECRNNSFEQYRRIYLTIYLNINYLSCCLNYDVANYILPIYLKLLGLDILDAKNYHVQYYNNKNNQNTSSDIINNQNTQNNNDVVDNNINDVNNNILSDDMYLEIYNNIINDNDSINYNNDDLIDYDNYDNDDDNDDLIDF